MDGPSSIPSTEPSKPCWKGINNPRLDTGLLTRRAAPKGFAGRPRRLVPAFARARADYQNQLVLRGDPEGTYGLHPPRVAMNNH
jgi:hypothetical protein